MKQISVNSFETCFVGTNLHGRTSMAGPQTQTKFNISVVSLSLKNFFN
jgi:hypothetical protein